MSKMDVRKSNKKNEVGYKKTEASIVYKMQTPV